MACKVNPLYAMLTKTTQKECNRNLHQAWKDMQNITREGMHHA